MRRHWKALTVGAVRSVSQFKAIIPTVAQRTGERSPQPISTADTEKHRNRSGHLHTVSLVPKEPDFGTKGQSGLSQSLRGVNTLTDVVGAKRTEKGPPGFSPLLSLKWMLVLESYQSKELSRTGDSWAARSQRSCFRQWNKMKETMESPSPTAMKHTQEAKPERPPTAVCSTSPQAVAQMKTRGSVQGQGSEALPAGAAISKSLCSWLDLGWEEREARGLWVGKYCAPSHSGQRCLQAPPLLSSARSSWQRLPGKASAEGLH